jgi:peptide/nickel transport system permease protein
LYLVRRLFESLLALWLASVIVFIGARSLPGDPAIALSGEGFDPVANEQIRKKYGLDEPVPVQYLRWSALALRGDLGRSIRTGFDVTHTILSRLPVTLELTCLSLLVTLLIGIPTGIASAVRRGGPLDYAANFTALFGLSVPPFWVGILLILLLASLWRLLPASGYEPF